MEKNKELCEKYSFLIPRNVWTDEVCEDYDYSYTRLDDLEQGWKIAFGERLCEELKDALAKANYVDKFRFTDIKEKWGHLCLYNFGCNQEAWDVIHKYERMSKYVCKQCGKPATKVSIGWISSYCDDCAEKLNRYEEFVDINKYYRSDIDGNN